MDEKAEKEAMMNNYENDLDNQSNNKIDIYQYSQNDDQNSSSDDSQSEQENSSDNSDQQSDNSDNNNSSQSESENEKKKYGATIESDSDNDEDDDNHDKNGKEKKSKRECPIVDSPYDNGSIRCTKNEDDSVTCRDKFTDRKINDKDVNNFYCAILDNQLQQFFDDGELKLQLNKSAKTYPWSKDQILGFGIELTDQERKDHVFKYDAQGKPNVVIKNYDVTLLFDNSRFKEKLLDVKIIKLSTKEQVLMGVLEFEEAYREDRIDEAFDYKLKQQKKMQDQENYDKKKIKEESIDEKTNNLKQKLQGYIKYSQFTF